MRGLAYRIGQLAETIVALPGLRVVLSAFPDADVTMLRDAHVESNYVAAEDVLPQNLVDSYLRYRCEDGRISVQEAPKLLRTIRVSKFDALIYLAPHQRSLLQLWRDLLFFRLAGIRRFYGHKGFEKLRMA